MSSPLGAITVVLGMLSICSTLVCPPSALAQTLQPIALECKLGDEPWQSCQMEVMQLGRHWFLQIGSDRIEFIHDGAGKVHMGKKGHWLEVTPRWAEDQSLCWGNVCARGEIPLD